MAALGTPQGLKVLAQATATAGLAVLYTVPAGTGVVIAKVVVANTDTSARTFAVQINIAAAASATKQYVYKDITVAANDTLEILQGLTLAATDTVSIIASVTAVVAFNVFGQEFV